MTDFAHFPRPGENYPYEGLNARSIFFQSVFIQSVLVRSVPDLRVF